MTTCYHKNQAPTATIDGLRSSQAGEGRHKCVVCAFASGYAMGQSGQAMSGEIERCKHGKIAPSMALRALPHNQGGTGRHKCTVCAFSLGYEEGISGLENGLKLLRTTAGSMTPSRRGQLTLVKSVPRRSRWHRPPLTLADELEIVDYAAIQAQNSALGLLGETLVLEFERARLNAAGLPRLAKAVQHTSRVIGDGAGYDIRSYSEAGSPIFIEVKTTRGPSSTPFFLTRNELEFWESNREHYRLYRVFSYDDTTGNAKVHIETDLEGAIDLTPIAYRATLR